MMILSQFKSKVLQVMAGVGSFDSRLMEGKHSCLALVLRAVAVTILALLLILCSLMETLAAEHAVVEIGAPLQRCVCVCVSVSSSSVVAGLLLG